ncbi:MAG: hypothetical protein ACUVQQ_10470 [Thermogutta sp.]
MSLYRLVFAGRPKFGRFPESNKFGRVHMIQEILASGGRRRRMTVLRDTSWSVARRPLLSVATVGTVVAAITANLFARTAFAQTAGSVNVPAPQAAVSIGASSASDSFFEMQGVSWSLVGPNWFARFGPRPPAAAPAFGGFPGDAGGGVGFGVRGGRVQGEFFGQWSQGYRSAVTFQSPSLMLSNGSYGWWWDGSFTPFVTGVVPVIGDRAGIPGGLGPLHDPQSKTLERSQALSAVTSAESGPPRNHAPANAAATDEHARAEADAAEGHEDGLAGIDGAANPANAASATTRSPKSVAAPAAEPVPDLSLSAGLPAKASVGAIAGANASRAWPTAVSEGLGVEEAAKLRAAEVAVRNAEAEALLRKASAALKAGRAGLAETYCRMALSRATGEVRTAVLHLQHRIAAARRQADP